MLTEEEAEVDDPTNYFKSEVVSAIGGRFDDVQGVGAAEVVDVEEIVPLPQQVEGKVSVGL